ncbi:MAG: redoxin domain-containing protein [Gammaproteobacteria bacterium]|nr:MAG: redoxin domain-containing protein [Gammaproteobacteria bacterium]
MQNYVEAYEEAGVGIVVITYDTPEAQQAFIDAGNITYPFISDIDTATMVALGILNERNEPGEPAYGIPHPGVFVVNLDNEIVGKIFIDSFRERVDGEGTLRYALEVLE